MSSGLINLYPDDETTILDTVDGILGPVDEEGEHSHLEAIQEDYEGGTYWYIYASSFFPGEDEEDGDWSACRVDLDRAGWERLKQLCDAVIADIDDKSQP